MSVTASDLVLYSSYYTPAYGGVATLAANITPANNTITITTPTSPFPASGEFPVQVAGEIMWVTQGAPGGSAGTLTVIRGYPGTTGSGYANTGTPVTMPIGGPPDFLHRPAFTDTSGTLNYVSSAGDGLVMITATGRSASGALVMETVTLQGMTPVTGSQTFARLLAVGLAPGTTAVSALTGSAAPATVQVLPSANFPSSGRYNIQMAKEVLLVVSGAGTTFWSVGRGQLATGPTVHNIGDNIYLLPVGDVAVYESTPTVTGTAQAGSTQTITLHAGQGASVSARQVIILTGGTGAGQIRTVVSISGDTVTVSRPWTAPDSTTTYVVSNGVQLESAPNQVTGVSRLFSGTGNGVYYQKAFLVNNNTASSLTTGAVSLTDSPALPASTALDIALDTTVVPFNTAVAANWTTPIPSFGPFIIQPAATPVTTNNGVIPAGLAPNSSGAVGIQFRLTSVGTYTGSADVTATGVTYA